MILINFHKNKLRYEDGQLAPFFILIIVVLIVMAMVTVNLSKVAFIKTATSNAADAAALAGGSLMAGVFNAQAAMNDTMENDGLTSRIALGSVAGLIIAAMLLGSSLCAAAGCSIPPYPCCPSPACVTITAYLPGAIIALILGVMAYHATQVLWWETMRDRGKEGREQAIQTAYYYGFANSNIGNMLLAGKSPAANRRGNTNNYQGAFSNFLKNQLSSNPGQMTYSWRDGQERNHSVRVQVETEEVGDYRLKIAFSPTLIVMAGLYIAQIDLDWLPALCGCCSAASSAMFTISAISSVILAASMAGLEPAWEVSEEEWKYFSVPAYVADIVHDKLFKVRVIQQHAGYDYGIWKMSYPESDSFSEASFAGGKISPPDASFEASIIKVE